MAASPPDSLVVRLRFHKYESRLRLASLKDQDAARDLLTLFRSGGGRAERRGSNLLNPQQTTPQHRAPPPTPASTGTPHMLPSNAPAFNFAPNFGNGSTANREFHGLPMPSPNANGVAPRVAPETQNTQHGIHFAPGLKQTFHRVVHQLSASAQQVPSPPTLQQQNANTVDAGMRPDLAAAIAKFRTESSGVSSIASGESIRSHITVKAPEDGVKTGWVSRQPSRNGPVGDAVPATRQGIPNDKPIVREPPKAPRAMAGPPRERVGIAVSSADMSQKRAPAKENVPLATPPPAKRVRSDITFRPSQNTEDVESSSDSDVPLSVKKKRLAEAARKNAAAVQREVSTSSSDAPTKQRQAYQGSVRPKERKALSTAGKLRGGGIDTSNFHNVRDAAGKFTPAPVKPKPKKGMAVKINKTNKPPTPVKPRPNQVDLSDGNPGVASLRKQILDLLPGDSRASSTASTSRVMLPPHKSSSLPLDPRQDSVASTSSYAKAMDPISSDHGEKVQSELRDESRTRGTFKKVNNFIGTSSPVKKGAETEIQRWIERKDLLKVRPEELSYPVAVKDRGSGTWSEMGEEEDLKEEQEKERERLRKSSPVKSTSASSSATATTAKITAQEPKHPGLRLFADLNPASILKTRLESLETLNANELFYIQGLSTKVKDRTMHEAGAVEEAAKVALQKIREGIEEVRKVCQQQGLLETVMVEEGAGMRTFELPEEDGFREHVAEAVSKRGRRVLRFGFVSAREEGSMQDHLQQTAGGTMGAVDVEMRDLSEDG